jgi:hypothetical protein
MPLPWDLTVTGGSGGLPRVTIDPNDAGKAPKVFPYGDGYICIYVVTDGKPKVDDLHCKI